MVKRLTAAEKAANISLASCDACKRHNRLQTSSESYVISGYGSFASRLCGDCITQLVTEVADAAAGFSDGGTAQPILYPADCLQCNGNGWVPDLRGSGQQTCHVCKGSGQR